MTQYFTKYKYLIALAIIIIVSDLFKGCTSSKNTISYNQHIRPIFNKKCLACHGGVKQLGDFSLLFREEALGETESGKKAIVPGNAQKSELYRRITHKDPEIRMPFDHAPLSQNEIDLIAQWINEGAEWEEHWAYIPPKANTIPSSTSDWPQTNIDQYIWRKLQENELTPAQEAAPATLARRLSLDLIGLPPEPEWIADFVANPNPENYAQFVDLLLDKPQFGERWTAMWLDLARYADSKGYEADHYRNIWRYRDWVINALNQDMPFDQFTIEQIAGDLLPNPTQEQLIATAFNRNSMTNTEGGTKDEEYRVSAVIDRVNTTFDVWMGTTISCVQCHTHPYDPIRQEEYYQTYAIFNNTKDSDQGDEYPNLHIYEEGKAEDIKAVIDYIQQLDPEKTIDKNADLVTQGNQALFPRLFPIGCDDINHVLVHDYRLLSNWSNNVNEQKDKAYFFKYDDIPLDGLKSIRFHYSSQGNDAEIIVRTNSKDGKEIGRLNFDKSSDKFWQGYTYATMPIQASMGKQNLVFEIINTTGKFPQGVVLIKELQLVYENDYEHPKIKAKQDELIKLMAQSDNTPIMQERSPAFQRSTNVFIRGSYVDKGQEVKAGVPPIFHDLPNEEKPRLAFAKWLVSKDNPLTARVIVNRFWEQLFGYGIIESTEDFGTQSLPATHPELLDYLALQFMHKHGWSVKQLLKEMVTSAAYKQSSQLTAEKKEKDPYNRFLSRGSRIRLTAEQIRDQALAVSGLLFDSIGGKSVMPPQPEGIWQVTYNNQRWITAEDKHKYRRGLYTYWRRTSPYPSMLAFDSPSREFCSSRRIRTNTPLQALVTLNDPVYVEAAQALAQRMEKAGDGNVSIAIEKGYELALLKKPDKSTLEVLNQLYLKAEQELNATEVKALPIAFEEKTGVAINNPMTVVANAIMNLDGFIMKE